MARQASIISPTCEANTVYEERLQLRRDVADPLRRCFPELLVTVDIQNFQRGKLCQRWRQLCKQEVLLNIYIGCVQMNLIPSSLAQKIAEISERTVVVIVHNGSHTQLIHN